ncbi:hypothetical protein EP7_001407 [Isosphaeraceae bacterium EP7]
MRRSLLLLALAINAAQTTAAQTQTGPGTIYYLYGSTTPRDAYRVSGNGTGTVYLGPTKGVRTTALEIYPGGRQIFGTAEPLGPIPGVSASYGDLMLISEKGKVPTTVTNFRGPQYLDQNGARCRFSNDQRDSFFSFVVYDTRTSLWVYYRYNGPVSDVFQPDFIPFSSDDPRLEYVISETNDYRFREFYDWDPTGTWLTYSDRDAAGRFVTSVHNHQTQTSITVNNPAVSGLDMTSPWGSSTEFRLFSPARYKDGTKGIVSFYPDTGRWSWVIKEGGTGSKYVDMFSPPAISPDGTTLAFGMRRMVGKYMYPSLVRVPASGGAYTPLVTYTDRDASPMNAGGLGWKW